MKFGKILMLLFLAGVVAVLFVGCTVWRGYNRAVTLDEGVASQWAEVENILQRRFDLIPNLVETVKGVAQQEQKVFLGIAESREAYFQAKGPAEKAQAASGFERALSRLLVLREQYPELKSNENFLKLQDSVEGSENRLAVARKRYNESVETLNGFIRRFPGQLYASLASVDKAEYFEVAEEAKEVPKVDFSGP